MANYKIGESISMCARALGTEVKRPFGSIDRESNP